MPPIATLRNARSCDILLVDDNAKAVRLVQEVLREADSGHRLHRASDGEEALQMLRQQAPHVDIPRPDLVLLDINLPTLSGIEVLGQIKADPVLCELPVLMLSSSTAEQDVDESLRRHANAYLVKPTGYDEFAALIRDSLHFWLNCARFVRPREVRP